ncbi:LysR family transcriptional regulator [Entomomonas moraniae]|uniref:LysR family transcriptional regulator n=1 Tax=Entomomonas moraniae TaxID=2213226 RepID=A0A3S9XC62_9GAMM|nr:LysR family transcriptional regulator [Entomomonas moraniae]AZS49898.1 LysR family transcriptional regulator [Entomomonas moraniae]
MSRIALPELSVFITVAEQLNFSAAARELGVSTSALSHSIRKLEERMKTQLFIRTTRSVALTDAGKQLFKRATPAINELELAIDELNSTHNRPSGTIRISAAEAGAKLIIQNMLPDFFKTYPDIHVEFVIDTRYVDIVAEGFNAGIRLLDDVPLDMVAIPFGPKEIKIVAVASPDYITQHGYPASPDDLRNHQCIQFRFLSGALYHWDFAYQGRSMSVDVNGPMTLGNTNLMVEAALTGIGIAWVPDYHVHEHIRHGRLVQILPEWSPCISRMCLYYPTSLHQPPALKLFYSAIRKWAKNEMPA